MARRLRPGFWECQTPPAALLLAAMYWLGWSLIALAGVTGCFTSVQYALRRLALRQVAECDKEPPLGWIPATLAFLREVLATIAVVYLVPIGWLQSRHDTEARPHGPLVLIHGWALNRGCWWVLRRRLARDGFGPIFTFEYASLAADVEAAAEQLRHFIDDLGEQEKPLTLIGHSLGGLVIRHYLRRHRAPTVRRVVTLGSPHHGTWLAAAPSPWRKRLAPASPLINQLNALDRLPQQFDTICVYSTFDAMILPWPNARYPQAFNIQVTDVGHNMLLFSRRVYALLRENLQTPIGSSRCKPNPPLEPRLQPPG